MAKPGKYAHLIDKLPRLLGEEPANRDKVNAIKDAIRSEYTVNGVSTLKATTLTALYVSLRDEKDTADAVVSEINTRLTAVTELMSTQFESEGIMTCTPPLGRGASVYLEPYTQVVDREANRLWCIKQGLENHMTISWMELNGLAKKLLLDGQPLPDGVTVYAKTKFRLGVERG